MLSLAKFSEQHRVTLFSHLADPSIAAALPQYHSEDLDSWVDFIMSDPLARVVEIDGEMIGACRVDNDISFWIASPYRGLGYATRLTEKLCRIGISLGWKQVGAQVEPTNTPSQKTLSRCGFFQESPTRWVKYL